MDSRGIIPSFRKIGIHSHLHLSDRNRGGTRLMPLVDVKILRSQFTRFKKRKARHILLLVSAFSILFFVLNNYAVFFSHNFLDAYYKIAPGDMHIRASSNSSSISLIQQDCANFIAQPHPIGYKGFVVARTNWFYGINVSHNEVELLKNVSFAFIGFNFSTSQLAQDLSFKYTIVNGAWPSQDNQILLSEAYAGNNGITVGDYLTFENESSGIVHQFQVSGLLRVHQEYLGLSIDTDQTQIRVFGALLPAFTLTFNSGQVKSSIGYTSIEFYLNHDKIDYWSTVITNGELAAESNLFLKEFIDKPYAEYASVFSSIGQATSNWDIMSGYNLIIIDFILILIPLGVIFIVLISGQIRFYLTEEIDNIKSLSLNGYSRKKVHGYYLKEQLFLSVLVFAGSIGLSYIATNLAYFYSTSKYPLLASGYLSVFDITRSSLLPWIAGLILFVIYLRMFGNRMKQILTQIDKSAVTTSFQHHSKYQKWKKAGKVMFFVLIIPVVQSLIEIFLPPETRVGLSYDLPYQILTMISDSIKYLLPFFGVFAFLMVFDQRIIKGLQAFLRKLVRKRDEVGKLFVKRVTAQRPRNVLLLFFFVAFSLFFISAQADQKYFEIESISERDLIQQGADAWLNLWHQNYSLTTSFFERINSTQKSLLHLIPCTGLIETAEGIKSFIVNRIVLMNYTEYSRALRPDCPNGFLSQVQLVETLQEDEILLPIGIMQEYGVQVGDKITLNFNNKTTVAPKNLNFTIKGFFDYFAGITDDDLICLAKDGPITQQYYQNFTMIKQYYLVDFPFDDLEIQALTHDGSGMDSINSLIFNFTTADVEKLDDEAYWVIVQNENAADVQTRLYYFLDLNLVGFSLFLATILLFFSHQFMQDVKLQLSRMKFAGYPDSSISAHLTKIVGSTCVAGLVFGNFGFAISYLLTRASGFTKYFMMTYPIVTTFPLDKLVLLNLVFGGAIVILSLLLRRIFRKSTYGYELLKRQANE